MANRVESVLDSRRNIRIKENRGVAWRVNGGEIQGKGKIKDISTSGMMIEMQSDTLPLEGSVVSFDANLGHNNFVPQSGRLIWTNQKGKNKNRYFCGIKFVEPGEFVLTKLRQRVQKGIIRIHNMRRVEVASNVMLITVIIGLTAYVVWQSGMIYQDISRSNEQLLSNFTQQAALTQSYSHRYHATALQLLSVGGELEATRQLYVESEGMLKTVTEELASTKAILVQTESMLVSARAGTADLQAAAQVAALVDVDPAQRNEIENTVALLQEKNVQLVREMATLQSQFTFLSGDIKNTDEGRMLVVLYRTKIKDVKGRIKHFREEARGVRVAAGQERDRIKLLLGNNGYFMKDGTTVKVDEEKYRAVGQIVAPQAAPAAREVNIDVTFFD